MESPMNRRKRRAVRIRSLPSQGCLFVVIADLPFRFTARTESARAVVRDRVVTFFAVPDHGYAASGVK